MVVVGAGLNGFAKQEGARLHSKRRGAWASGPSGVQRQSLWPFVYSPATRRSSMPAPRSSSPSRLSSAARMAEAAASKP